MRKIISIITVAILALGVIAPALATNVGVTDTKAQNFISVSGVYPGASFNKKLIIFNPYNQERKVRLSTVDIATKTDFFPIKNISENQTSIGKWTTITDTVTLPALGSEVIDIQFDIPQNILDGSYAGALIIEDLNSNEMEMKMRFYVTVDSEKVTIEKEKAIEAAKAPEVKNSISLKGQKPRTIKRNFIKVSEKLNDKPTVFFNEATNKRIQVIRAADSMPRQENSAQSEMRKRYEALIRNRY